MSAAAFVYLVGLPLLEPSHLEQAAALPNATAKRRLC